MRRTLGLAPIALADWPTVDAAQWRAALVRGGVFDAGGALAGRTERDLKQFRYCYGVWLAFLLQDRHDRVFESGLDHLCETDLRPFLLLLEGKLASYSVLAILRGLLATARAMTSTRAFRSMRAAIYARYSSENQREASIEDQVEICRRYATQHGLNVVTVYDDKAISGSDRNRPGFQALLTAARRRQFDLVLVEALDRLTRRLSDVAAVFDELQFLGLGLHAVNVGPVTTMHVGLLGTMAQMFLSDLRDKTKRGQLGRVLKGRVAGGKAYGYDVLPGDESGYGARRINAAEAEIVRRIFRLFSGGMSPRAIAKKLNSEGTKGPGGRPWQDTTVRGQKKRGTGILNNELYVGRIAWNRCSYVKDPRTGKRLARINPEASREYVDAPELRIIDVALWLRVKERQTEIGFQVARDEGGNALNRAHRRKFLLSGLLVCGCCGAGYTIVGKDAYGCRRHRGMGICANSTRVSRAEVERRILTALKEKLIAPDLIAEFTRAYQEEVNRLAATASSRQADRERLLKAVERKIQAIMDAIEKGLYSPSMNDRMRQLEAERLALQKADEATPAPQPVMIHPNLAELYRRRVMDLEKLLTDPELGSEAMDLIRSMITEIKVVPRKEAEGVDLELAGDLARILHLCGASSMQNAQAVGAGRLSVAYEVSVVAGKRNQLYRTTFALPAAVRGADKRGD